MELQIYPETQALIFDLDGTLSNSLPVHMATWNKIGEQYGFKFDPAILLELTGRPTIEFAKRIVKQYGLTVDPEVIVKLKQESFWESHRMLKPIEEIIAVVKRYHKKLPMSVGTGASRKSAEVQLKALDIARYFDFIVSAEDVTRHKPEPDTFLECARLMKVDPASCQVFEDGELGITAAKKAGMMVTDVRPYIKYGEWMHS